jgi:hypothetical protein
MTCHCVECAPSSTNCENMEFSSRELEFTDFVNVLRKAVSDHGLKAERVFEEPVGVQYLIRLVEPGILQMTPEPAWIFAVSLAPCKAEAQFGQLPSPRAARTVVGGLIWPFSLAFGHTPPISRS